jgi:hypothetical protein
VPISRTERLSTRSRRDDQLTRLKRGRMTRDEKESTKHLPATSICGAAKVADNVTQFGPAL